MISNSAVFLILNHGLDNGIYVEFLKQPTRRLISIGP